MSWGHAPRQLRERASGGTVLRREVWKVPHGPGGGWGKASPPPRVRRRVHAYFQERAPPPARVRSCWHFHRFNHRLREMLWEAPRDDVLLRVGCLSPPKARTRAACQSLTSGSGRPTCLLERSRGRSRALEFHTLQKS